MKRFFSTVVLCASLLVVLSYFLFPPAQAAENPILALLNLPAPPPPNPEVSFRSSVYPDDFYNRSKPPDDDMPIEALMDYWRVQASDYSETRYKVYPSEKVLGRLIAEISKNPEQVTEFLNIFPPNHDRATAFVKDVYEKTNAADEPGRGRRTTLRRWLKYNTGEFSSELVRDASRVSDTEGYVTHHRELVALARVDWDRAEPIVNRLYNSVNQRATKTAALWALYLHAMESSPGDTERYRDELKATVADKTLPDGIRDLALDALSMEKDWSGRDEWYVSLFEDETLLELGSYTGLTTLMSASPSEKYIDRMIGLLDNDNINVRSAAARNLMMKIDLNRPEIVRALLPWLRDAKWISPNIGRREILVQALSRVKLPDSVPYLIAALDERSQNPNPSYGSNANAAAARAVAAAANAANAAAIAANMAANAVAYSYEDPFPLRRSAVGALAFQEDARAVPALRRLLNEVGDSYGDTQLVGAIYSCGGFTIAEQVNAIERFVEISATLGDSANSNSGMIQTEEKIIGKPAPLDTETTLGLYLAAQSVVKDDLARGVVDRITSLDRTDPKTANAMRQIVMRWHAPAINALLLRDLKNRRTDQAALVRLLSVRQELREKQQADVYDLRTGSPTALGISACLVEDPNDYQAILDGSSDEAKSAMLACARLIRAPLSVSKVAENLTSKDKLLAVAAERYLESEDSPEARRIVLSLHPGEAMILGAKTAFYTSEDDTVPSESDLRTLFGTVNRFFAQSPEYEYAPPGTSAEDEQRLQDEVKKTPDLLGVYGWQQNFIHIYKDRAVFSWHEDPARYRERTLTKEEFDNFRGLIAHFKLDEMPPYLQCWACEAKELLMLGRNGGRRLFVKATTLPPFASELERVFTDLRSQPSTIKYWAAKDVPGLELLFADDRLNAMAVWKSGSDVRLLTADKIRGAEIESELNEIGESIDQESVGDALGAFTEEREKREYENFSWRAFAGGSLGEAATQPVDVPYIPAKDSFEVPAAESQWKSRAGTVEIRADKSGLYKISAGRMTKVRPGNYADPLITPNGRWAIATKFDDDVGAFLVRINLATNREFKVASDELPAVRAIAYVASVNRILVGPYDDEYEEFDEVPESDRPATRYSWLNPDTGGLFPGRGEVRPLADQTYRPLQPAANPFEFWATVPKDEGTVIGIYSTRNFVFRPLVTLSKIKFDSMNMWVDGIEAKAYFVYEGQLLRVPLRPAAK